MLTSWILVKLLTPVSHRILLKKLPARGLSRYTVHWIKRRDGWSRSCNDEWSSIQLMDSHQRHARGLKSREHLSVTLISVACARGLSATLSKTAGNNVLGFCGHVLVPGLQRAALTAPSSPVSQQRPPAAPHRCLERSWMALSALCTFPCAASGKEVRKREKEKAGFSLLLVFVALVCY